MGSTLSNLHSKENVENLETRHVIADMLKENTGRHMLDSGDAYGRNWEENQGKKFEEEPRATHEIEIWDGEISILSSVSTYHVLKHRLNFDSEALQVNKQFYERATSNSLDGKSWLSCMKACFGGCSVNTYNHEFHNTDQVLQFVYFSLEPVASVDERAPRPEEQEYVIGDMIYRVVEDVHGDWVALQVHNGADVRSGYTAPVVFKAPHGSDYLIMEVTTDVSCPECGWLGCQYETVREGDWSDISVIDEHEDTGLTELVHDECGSVCEVSASCAV